MRVALWLVALFPLAGAELRVLDMDVRAGAMAQVRLALSEPLALAAGSFVIEFDPAVFGDVADVQVFSAAGDAIGKAITNGRRVEVSFNSPSGGVGRLPGLPVATITVPVMAGAVNGAVQVQLGALPWKDVSGTVYPLSVAAGEVRIGAELTVGSVTPGGGLLPIGTVVRIGGTGFRPDTVVEVPGVVVSRTAYVSPEEVTFTVGGATELTGKTIHVRNPNGPVADFVAAQFVGTTGSVPVFPLRAFPSIRSTTVANNLGGRRGIALLNPHSEAVEVVVEIRNPVGGLSERKSITLAPRAVFIEPDLRTIGVQSFGYAGLLPAKPIRAVSLSLQAFGTPELSVFEITSEYAAYQAPDNPLRSSLPLLSFRHQTGTPAPAAQKVTITESVPTLGGFAFNYLARTTSGGPWLSAASTPDIANGLTVRADPTGLPAGTYSGEIVVTPSPAGGTPLIIPATLSVNPNPFITLLRNFNSSYVLGPGAAPPPPQNFTVTSSGAPVLLTPTVKTDKGGAWLTVSPASASTPATFAYAVNPAGLPGGTYTGTVSIAGGANVEVFEVYLLVPPAAGERLESLAPASLRYSYAAGAARASSIAISVNPFRIAYTVATSGESWLQTAPITAGAGGLFEVKVDPITLPIGTHTAKVIVTSDAGDKLELPVSVTIWSGDTPALTATPSSMRLVAPGPSEQQSIAVSSGGLPLEVTVRPEMSANSCTLNGRPVSTTGNQFTTPLTIQVSCPGPPGDYEGKLVITAGTQSAVVPVSVHIDPTPYTGIVTPPVVGAIVNAASGAIGPIAPGQFISIHGTGVGVPVTIDGAAVTPVYSSLFQTNVQVPGSVKGTAVIGVGPVLTTLPVVAAAPGIFTLKGSGVGPGAVLNEDNSINTPDNPAARGSVIQIFGTGDGEQAVLMEALIGGNSSEVLYGGSLTGLWQVNARVPADAAPGPRVPLVLRVGGVPTQSGVTVSVQ